MTNIEALLVEIRDDQKEILRRLARLEELQAPAAARSKDTAFAHLVFGAVELRSFSSTELLDHGKINAALGAEFNSRNISTPKKLGRLLGKMEQKDFGGLTLRCVAREAGGRVWAFSVSSANSSARLAQTPLSHAS